MQAGKKTCSFTDVRERKLDWHPFANVDQWNDPLRKIFIKVATKRHGTTAGALKLFRKVLLVVASTL